MAQRGQQSGSSAQGQHFPSASCNIHHHAGAGLKVLVTMAGDELGGAPAEERGRPSRSVLVPLAAEVTVQMDLSQLPFQKSVCLESGLRSLHCSAYIRSFGFAAGYLFIQKFQS